MALGMSRERFAGWGRRGPTASAGRRRPGATADDGPHQELVDLIESLPLDELQKRSMRLRWLDQLTWLDRTATSACRRHRVLRSTAVVGAILVPAIVSLNLRGDAGAATGWAAFGISLLVALSAAVDELFRFGDRWHHHRRSAEQLKAEGWSFVQFSPPYQAFAPSHARAYPTFAQRVEAILQTDVEVYFREIVAPDDERSDRATNEEDEDRPAPLRASGTEGKPATTAFTEALRRTQTGAWQQP